MTTVLLVWIAAMGSLVVSTPLAAQSIRGESRLVEEQILNNLSQFRKERFYTVYEKFLGRQRPHFRAKSRHLLEALGYLQAAAGHLDEYPGLSFQYCTLAEGKIDRYYEDEEQNEQGGQPGQTQIAARVNSQQSIPLVLAPALLENLSQEANLLQLSGKTTTVDGIDILREFLGFCKAKVFAQEGLPDDALDLLERVGEWDSPNELKRLAFELKLNTLWERRNFAAYIQTYDEYSKLVKAPNRDEQLIWYAALSYQKTPGRGREYFEALEMIAKSYPLTEYSHLAIDRLNAHAGLSGKVEAPAYVFSLELLRKINRNFLGHHPFQEKLAGILNRTVKTSAGGIKTLSPSEKVTAYMYIRGYDEARSLAESLLNSQGASIPPGLQAQLWAWIGWTTSMTGDYAASEAAYERAISIGSGRGGVVKETYLISLADSLSRQGKHRLAAQRFAELVDRSGEKELKWKHFWSTYLSDDYQEAYQLVTRNGYVAGWDAQEPLGHAYWKAKIMLKGGQRDEGLMQMKQIAAQNPSSYYGLMALGHLKDNQQVGEFDAMVTRPSPQRFPKPYNDIVDKVVAATGVDKYLLLSIMKAESSFTPSIESPVGARGLMQLMPYTAIRIARLIDDNQFVLHQMEEPAVNIAYGGYYLGRLLTYYKGNYILAIAAYNAGPIAVKKWLSSCGGCQADEFVELIGYLETRHYVKRVMRFYASYRLLYEGRPTFGELPYMPDTAAIFQDYPIF
jgi:soluble lytic murein transglycosylase-like protein